MQSACRVTSLHQLYSLVAAGKSRVFFVVDDDGLVLERSVKLTPPNKLNCVLIQIKNLNEETEHIMAWDAFKTSQSDLVTAIKHDRLFISSTELDKHISGH